MAYYMIQFSYSKEAVAAMVKQPEDRSKAVKALADALGGKLVSFYYSFGEFDGLAIIETADNTTTLAAVLAAVAPGHLSKLKTTVLIPMEDAVEAMEKARSLSLAAPGG